MATSRFELPKSPLQFGDAEAAPASGGLFGGGGFGDDQFAQLLMGLALLDSGRPRVNPPSAMETIAPLAAMLSQQSNQKNALNFFNSVNKNAPSAAGLLAGGTDASPDVSAFTGMPGQATTSGAPARGMVAGGAIPGGGVGERVAATLRNRGWSDAAIEGALNNSITESSLNPNATGAAGEKGLFQFHPKSHVSPFTQSYGGDWSPEAQANYVADTVERSMPSYKLAKNGNAATADFMLGFERPKNQSASAIAYRAANGDASRAILGRIGNGTAAPLTMRLASATPQTMTDAAPEGAPASNPQGPVPSGSTASILAQYTPKELAAYRARGMIGPSGIPTLPPGSSKINSRGEPYSPDLETMPSQAKANVAASMAAYRGEPNAAASTPLPPAAPPTPVISPRAAVTQAYATGALPDVSPQQLRQAQAAMPNTMAPRSPETVTGPRTQAAYAARMFDHWGRAAVGAGMLGAGGAGLVEYAKAQMALATEFMKPSEAQKNIQMLPPELRPRAAYVLNMKGSPELAGQEEFAKRNAGLPFIGPETAIKEGVQTQEAWRRPDASAELTGAKAGATEQAQVEAKARAMGFDLRTPEGQAAYRRTQPDSRPALLQEADATMGNPALKNEVVDLKRAGANNITQKVEGQGQAALVNAGIKQMETAFTAENAANRRTQLYGQMAQAVQGFTPGATAELRLRGQSILKDLGIIKGENVPDAEIFRQAGRQLQIHAQPSGQGQVSNFERELYAEALPRMTDSPEGLAKAIDIGRRLDDYDRQIAKVHRDVAREHGGLPDPIEAQERIASLGSPLSVAETNALNMLKESNQSGAATAAATPSGPASTQPGNQVYDPAQQKMVPVSGQPAPQQSTPIPKVPAGKRAIDYNSAISTLKQNPTKTNQFYFDQVYGAGAAARELGK